MGMTQQYSNRHSGLQDEVNEWVHFFPQPPEGFNPLTARPEDLVCYGIRVLGSIGTENRVKAQQHIAQ
jgi:hypothetical protein